jgi:DNA-binding NarL/FixJ family response regulator
MPVLATGKRIERGWIRYRRDRYQGRRPLRDGATPAITYGVRVLLLEPDAWRYRGICSALLDSGTVEILGEPDHGRILSLTAAPPDLKPNVVVIAHRLVLEYGVSIIALMRDVFDPCNVLVHGEVDSSEVAASVFVAGARGYFVLSHPPGLLAKAVNIVGRGKYWGPREAVARMAEKMTEDLEEIEDTSKAVDEEERQLLVLLNEGLSNKEIAQRLGLAEPTIKAKFNRLYKRFGVATRLQLLTTAIREGILRPMRNGSG